MTILIPSKNIFNIENSSKDNIIREATFEITSNYFVVDEDSEVYNKQLYDYSSGALSKLDNIYNTKIENDYFYSNVIGDTKQEYNIDIGKYIDYKDAQCTISAGFLLNGYLDPRPVDANTINIYRRQNIYDFITNVKSYTDTVDAEASVSINGIVKTGEIECYIGKKITNSDGGIVYVQTFSYKNIDPQSRVIQNSNSSKIILNDIITETVQSTTSQSYTIPTELEMSVSGFTLQNTTKKTVNYTFNLDGKTSKFNTLETNAKNLTTFINNNSGIKLKDRNNFNAVIDLTGFCGCKCVSIGGYYVLSNIEDNKDYAIKNCKYYYYNDSGTELTFDIENLKLKGTYTEYIPKTVTLSINGSKKTFSIDNSFEFISDNDNVNFEDNELMQDGNVYVSPQKGNIGLGKFLSDNIIKQYENGKELLTLICDIDDYYDTDGNKVIDKLNKEVPMTFNFHDIVIPYKNKDTPISTYKNGNAKAFEVVAINFSYSGCVRQTLTLLEILEEELNNG